MENRENINFKIADPEKIPCRNCKYGWLNYFMGKNCAKYKEKPDEIYYGNQDCPFFKETKENG